MKVVAYVASNGITSKYLVKKCLFYYIKWLLLGENPSTMEPWIKVEYLRFKCIKKENYFIDAPKDVLNI